MNTTIFSPVPVFFCLSLWLGTKYIKFCSYYCHPYVGFQKLMMCIFRRQVTKSKSVLELLLFGEDGSGDDLRNKNIRQTELLVDLREAVLQVGRHFQVGEY